ncbi:hypothetical protein [Streptomyces europaeiscabiei]|uniref:hypothetical protein n=1 Tax=Streptomyces europaeiscabiei TaxID=146819 RepID=UPI002E174D62
MKGSEFAFEELSIVARGAFTPITLTPAWLSTQELISEDDLQIADVDIVSPTATVFSIGAFRIQVTPDGMQIVTPDPAETERARDLMIGILRGHPHTPLAVLGLNRSIHFTPATAQEWHAIGDALAPKGVWEEQEILNLPGIIDVTMQGVRPDKYSGYVRVKVQPSSKVSSSVFISVNDHFTLTRVNAQPTKREDPPLDSGEEGGNFTVEKLGVALEILASEWSSFLQRSEKAIDFVSSLGGGRKK